MITIWPRREKYLGSAPRRAAANVHRRRAWRDRRAVRVPPRRAGLGVRMTPARSVSGYRYAYRRSYVASSDRRAHKAPPAASRVRWTCLQDVIYDIRQHCGLGRFTAGCNMEAAEPGREGAMIAANATNAANGSTVAALAKVGGSAVHLGGSAIWAAGSYLSAYVGGEKRSAASNPGVYSSAMSVTSMAADDGMMRGLGSAEVLRIANTLSGIFST
eukprot:3552256-Pleurochrysis_carterae.AAC.2